MYTCVLFFLWVKIIYFNFYIFELVHMELHVYLLLQDLATKSLLFGYHVKEGNLSMPPSYTISQCGH